MAICSDWNFWKEQADLHVRLRKAQLQKWNWELEIFQETFNQPDFIPELTFPTLKSGSYQAETSKQTQQLIIA